MREGNNVIYVRELDIYYSLTGLDSGFIMAVDESDVNSKFFIRAREFSESLLDLHFFSVTSSWSACLEGTEEVVLFNDSEDNIAALIDKLGGHQRIMDFTCGDSEYLSKQYYWKDHPGLFFNG